jgi:beta-phosphoglucomutase-like phosphatase (HAD superfamily)
MYIDGCKYLNLPPSKCAMVAAILPDLQAAAKVGMKVCEATGGKQNRITVLF